MFGSDLALRHQVTESRMRDVRNEAEYQRSVQIALDTRPRTRWHRFSEARTAVAMLLLRAGSWLLPDDARSGHKRPVHTALELRLGR
jgi:hypothetical protein